MTASFTGGAAISYAILGSSVEQKWSSEEDLNMQVPDDNDDERRPLVSATNQHC